jgi:transcriptional regulator with XRE-family HTH domain
MRERMGMTQAEFADEWGVALPTVGRWESSTPPTGVHLERLASAAERKGFRSVAATFRHALSKERRGGLPSTVCLRSEKESIYVGAVLDVLEGADPALAGLRPALARVLKPAIEARKRVVGV